MDEITKDNLLDSIENASTYFLEFNEKCTAYGDSVVYCLVENYDLCFYPHRVADILGRKVEGIPCEGKNNLIELYSDIRSKPEYNKYLLRCFVDADFDDNDGIDNHIYVTNCYSIENLYMEENVISRVLENEYKIRPYNFYDKHKKCLDLFRTELLNFHQAVLLYNAWYRGIKKKGLTKAHNVCLGDNVPRDIIDLNIGAIKAHYNKSDLENKYPLAPVLSDEEINDNVEALKANPRMMRGKFEIQFLHKYFEFLNADSSSHSRLYTILTHGVRMDRNKMIATLDNYVETPIDMRNYIIKGVRITT